MKRDEFEKKMTQLLELLKGIMKHYPNGESQFSSLFDQKPGDKMNINICVFNFIPVTPEEMEELEDLYGDILESNEEGNKGNDKSLNFDLTKGDLEFLKHHGMSF